jgi:hypothetical protein
MSIFKFITNIIKYVLCYDYDNDYNEIDFSYRDVDLYNGDNTIKVDSFKLHNNENNVLVSDCIKKKDNEHQNMYFDINFISFISCALDKNFFHINIISDQVIKIYFKINILSFCYITQNNGNYNIFYNIIISSIFDEICGNLYLYSVGDIIDKLRDTNNNLYYLVKNK